MSAVNEHSAASPDSDRLSKLRKELESIHGTEGTKDSAGAIAHDAESTDNANAETSMAKPRFGGLNREKRKGGKISRPPLKTGIIVLLLAALIIFLGMPDKEDKRSSSPGDANQQTEIVAQLPNAATLSKSFETKEKINNSQTFAGHALREAKSGDGQEKVYLYKDWVCFNCFDFGDKNPEVLYLYKLSESQQQSRTMLSDGKVDGWVMIVARRGFSLPETELKTVLQNYEIDCRSRRMRLVYAYGYDDYFLNNTPVASAQGERVWVTPNKFDYQGVLFENACRYLK